MAMKPCGNPTCTQLHTNRVYCSYACRNTGEWRKHVTDGLIHVRAMKQRQFALLMQRMVQRVRYLGRTEEERLILAWRAGLGASKGRRYRAKRAAARRGTEAR